MEASMHDQPIARALALAALLIAPAAFAVTPADIAQGYAEDAKHAAPQFGGFSAPRGKAFFQSTHGGEWSCASCHTANPVDPGRHAKTGKTIAPLAPAGDPERFTSLGKAEKWFRRNCNDVLDRACTAQEKGDILAYLMQLSNGGRR
jgi:mono/diheme cytochrome c family protein